MKLTLEKNYYFNAIKEIAVTDSFLALDEDKIGCQRESIDDCTTNRYLNDMIEKCQCLPSEIRLNNKV